MSDERRVDKVGVGRTPNGLAFDPGRERLLSAHVGDPTDPGSSTVSVIDVASAAAHRGRAGRRPHALDRLRSARRRLPRQHRGSVADRRRRAPAIRSGIARVVAIPHAGPHGLDIDVARRRLYCACDDGILVEVDADTGAIVTTDRIAGTPDVVCFNARSGISTSRSAIPA